MKKSIADWRVFEFVKENNGNFSSTRLFAFAIITSAIIEWEHAIWYLGGIWKPDYMTIGLICGVLGLKVLQKSAEQKVDLISNTEVDPLAIKPSDTKITNKVIALNDGVEKVENNIVDVSDSVG